MNRKILQMVAALIFLTGNLLSQNLTIAVLEFVNKPETRAEYREMVENAFSQAAKAQGRFTVLERAEIEKIIAAREGQKSESYVDAIVAEQGKALGADYLVIGEILDGGAFDRQVQAMGSYSASRNVGYNLTLNVRIVATATAEVLYSHQQKIGQSQEFGTQNSGFKLAPGEVLPEIMQAFTGNCRNYAGSVYLEAFPALVQILEVDASGKKARKATVGTTAKLRDGQIIEVFLEELVEVDGENISRKVKIGEMYVMEMQGEKLARCYVHDGHKEILAFFNEGKKMICSVKNWKLRGPLGREYDSFQAIK